MCLNRSEFSLGLRSVKLIVAGVPFVCPDFKMQDPLYEKIQGLFDPICLDKHTKDNNLKSELSQWFPRFTPINSELTKSYPRMDPLER